VPLPGSLTLEASATGKPVANEKLEVQMKFKADGPVPPLASLEWSAERAGGTMIFSGRGPEFKRELPFGTYKVEFIIRSESGRAVRARKTIEVNPDGVTQK
jgi:hypothetical protein